MADNDNQTAQEFLTPTQLIARWGNAIGEGTLANWRAQGKGPKFVKLGAKVVYRLADVIEYEAAQQAPQAQAGQ